MSMFVLRLSAGERREDYDYCAAVGNFSLWELRVLTLCQLWRAAETEHTPPCHNILHGAMVGIVQRAIRVCRQPHDSSVGRASNASAEGRLTRFIRASEYHIRGRGAARQRHVRRGTWIGKS